MQEQLQLFDLRFPKDGPNCLFVASLLPRGTAPVASATGEDLQRDHHPRGVLRPVDHLHATVYCFGNYEFIPDEDVRRARATCEFAASRVASFRYLLDQALTFTGSQATGKRALVLASSEATPEMHRLSLVLSAADTIRRKGRKRSSKLHVTVSYVHEALGGRAIDPIPLEMAEIVLIHSLQGQTEYKILGRWKLTGAASALA